MLGSETIAEIIEKVLTTPNPISGTSFMEAARKQMPLYIKTQNSAFNCVKCVCGHIFSVHHGNGYYSLPEKRKTNYCPDCGQRLHWENILFVGLFYGFLILLIGAFM